MRASFSRSMHKRTSTYFSPLFDEMEEVSPEASHRSRAHAAPREREAYGHNHRPAVAPSHSPMPIHSDTQYSLSLMYSSNIVIKYTLIYPPYIVHHDVFALCPGLGIAGVIVEILGSDSMASLQSSPPIARSSADSKPKSSAGRMYVVWSQYLHQLVRRPLQKS